jgi:outer membrane protein TolC
MSIDDAVKEALKNSYKINSSIHMKKASIYKYKAAKSLKMPSFFLDSAYTLLDNEKNLIFSTPIGNQNIKLSEQEYINLSTGIKLNIYTGGFISGTISKTLYEKNAAENSLEETKLDIVYNTKIAYINILQLTAYKEIAEKHVQALTKHYNNVKELYAVGLVPFIDKLETNVKLNEALQNLTSIKNSIKVAKANLSIIMGRTLSDNITTSQVKKNFVKNFNITELLENAEKNRPVLKMVSNKIKAAQSAIDIAKSEYKPKLYIIGGYNYSNIQNNIKDKDNFLIQAGVKLQIDWDKSFNEVTAIKENKISLINMKKDILSNTLLGVKKAYEDYNTAVSNLKVAESMVKNAKEYFRTVTFKYKEGLTDNSHVLDAEAMVTKALMTYENYQFNIIKKYYLLERVTGKDLEK